jgi:hypothetical protein
VRARHQQTDYWFRELPWFVPTIVRVPVTALLLPQSGGGTVDSGRLTARHAITIGERDVPLEYEPTSALAEMLAASDVTARAKAAGTAADFSARIREGLPARPTPRALAQ